MKRVRSNTEYRKSAKAKVTRKIPKNADFSCHFLDELQISQIWITILTVQTRSMITVTKAICSNRFTILNRLIFDYSLASNLGGCRRLITHITTQFNTKPTQISHMISQWFPNVCGGFAGSSWGKRHGFQDSFAETGNVANNPNPMWMLIPGRV